MGIHRVRHPVNGTQGYHGRPYVSLSRTEVARDIVVDVFLKVKNVGITLVCAVERGPISEEVFGSGQYAFNGLSFGGILQCANKGVSIFANISVLLPK